MLFPIILHCLEYRYNFDYNHNFLEISVPGTYDSGHQYHVEKKHFICHSLKMILLSNCKTGITGHRSALLMNRLVSETRLRVNIIYLWLMIWWVFLVVFETIQ